MKTRIFIVLSCLVVLLLFPAGCGKQEGNKPAGTQGEKMKVAFVYVGPVGDAGWTLSHDRGRKYLEEKLPGVTTSFMENVPETSDAERVLTNLAMQGNRVIFTTSYGYMDATIKVAEKFPHVVFMHCSGYKTGKNVGTYFGRIEQPRYLSGIVAGKMTKTNILGYVAAHPIPEVVRGINAFTLGVRKVNKNAKVKVVWTYTWYNPPDEREAAESLLDLKADVIAQHQDTTAPQVAAQDRGVFGVGYNTDMSLFAPKAELTSPIWNWGPYYVKIVKSVMDGTWKSESYWGGMSDGIVDLAPLGPMVPEEVKKMVAEERGRIEKGEVPIFEGPLKDNKGIEKVARGVRMTDQELLKYDWFVEGVTGTVQK